MILNNGAYHPRYNSHGWKKIKFNALDYLWDDVALTGLTVSRDFCFEQTNISESLNSGRPDGAIVTGGIVEIPNDEW